MPPKEHAPVSTQMQRTEAIDEGHRAEIAKQLAAIPDVQASRDKIIPPSETGPNINPDALPELIVENATSEAKPEREAKPKLNSLKDWWMGLRGRPREGYARDFLQEKEDLIEEKTGGEVVRK